MEAGIHGFRHGEIGGHHTLSDALVFADTKTHEVSKSVTSGDGSSGKLVSDSYTNAQGQTVVSSPEGEANVTTRDDIIHAHFERTAQSTSVRNGDVTKTHTTSDAQLQSSDHATIVAPNGTVTVVDSNKTVTADTTADSTVKADAKSVSVKTADGTQTTTKGTSQSSGTSETDFTINADGTIVDSHGNKVVLSETGHGTTVSEVDGSSKGTSTTVAQTTRDAHGADTTGTTASTSTSKSERDTTTSYEGVLSSTTANGKTTTRYIDYIQESDVSTTATTRSVDDFSVQSEAATKAAGKAGGPVTQTIDATSDAQSAILSQRSDQVHTAGKADKDGDATVVKSTDHVEAQSLRETTFQSSATIVTGNGAVTTTANRTVDGETDVASQTDATVHSTVSTQKIAGGTLQAVNRNTDAQTESEVTSNYDAKTTTNSSNGASSVRTDHVSSETDYDVRAYTRYVAVVRTVVTPAASSTFAASA